MNIPWHPLVVHATVALLPAATIAATLYVLVPRWRWLLRWPTAVLAVLAAVSLQVARMTGDTLANSMGGESNPKIEQHNELAGLLTVAAYPFAAAAVLAAWALASTTPLPSGAGARAARWGVAGTVLRVLVPLLALAVLVLTVLTGHAGATAVWAR